MPKIEPYSVNVRRAAMDLFSEGVTPYKIHTRYQVDPATIRGWAKQMGIIHGSKLSPPELDAIFEEWSAKQRDRGPRVPGSAVSERMDRQRKAHTAGPEKVLSLYKDLGDPDTYKEALNEHYHHLAERLDRETSMEGQVSAMSASMLIASLRGAIDAPPPIATWADMERCIKLLRLTLGMDDKKGAGSEGPDLRILNAPTTARKVIEVKTVKEKLA